MPSVDKAIGEGNAESESLGDRESAGKPPTTTRLSALLLMLMLMLMLIKVAGFGAVQHRCSFAPFSLQSLRATARLFDDGVDGVAVFDAALFERLALVQVLAVHHEPHVLLIQVVRLAPRFEHFRHFGRHFRFHLQLLLRQATKSKEKRKKEKKKRKFEYLRSAACHISTPDTHALCVFHRHLNGFRLLGFTAQRKNRK
jgi:hypothetical protein